MTDKTALGDRMKGYESVSRVYLTRRMPLIIRVDGRAFHTYTRQFKPHQEGPWSTHMRDAMTQAARWLVGDISGAKLAYVQSDEISILVTDYDKLTSQPWFDKNLQKVCSVSASIATAGFNEHLSAYGFVTKPAMFDSRCFVLPREEACNYFIWRQQDATRNSISMLAQAHFSHKQLHQKSTGVMQEMLFSEKGINWNDCEIWQKRGWCITRETVTRTVTEEMLDAEGNPPPGSALGEEFTRTLMEPDWEIPIFSKDRDYVDRHVSVDGDDYVA